MARVQEINQRVKILEAEGGDVEGEDPVSAPALLTCARQRTDSRRLGIIAFAKPNGDVIPRSRRDVRLARSVRTIECSFAVLCAVISRIRTVSPCVVFPCGVQVALRAEAKEVEAGIAEKQKELDLIERSKTWNWENMCHVTEERTIINKSAESEVRRQRTRRTDAALRCPWRSVLASESVALAFICQMRAHTRYQALVKSRMDPKPGGTNRHDLWRPQWAFKVHGVLPRRQGCLGGGKRYV